MGTHLKGPVTVLLVLVGHSEGDVRGVDELNVAPVLNLAE